MRFPIFLNPDSNRLIIASIGTYLGLGCSAHSSLGAFRFSNVHTPGGYEQAILEKGHGVIEKEVLSTEDRFLEAMVFGLRQRRGVSIPQLEKRFLFSTPETVQDRLKQLQTHGLLYSPFPPKDTLHLTPKGVHLADEVALHLLAHDAHGRN